MIKSEFFWKFSMIWKNIIIIDCAFNKLYSPIVEISLLALNSLIAQQLWGIGASILRDRKFET